MSAACQKLSQHCSLWELTVLGDALNAVPSVLARNPPNAAIHKYLHGCNASIRSPTDRSSMGYCYLLLIRFGMSAWKGIGALVQPPSPGWRVWRAGEGFHQPEEHRPITFLATFACKSVFARGTSKQHVIRSSCLQTNSVAPPPHPRDAFSRLCKLH